MHIKPWALLFRIALTLVVFGVASGLSWLTLAPVPVLGYYGTLLAAAAAYKFVRLLVSFLTSKIFRIETVPDLLVMVVVADLISMAAVFFLLPIVGGAVAVVGSGFWMWIRMIFFFVVVSAANTIPGPE